MADADLVLVTGASGFIAKHVIKQALARGFRVRGTLRSPEREKAVRAAVAEAGDRLTFIQADLLSDEGWAEAAAGCRYVLHIASVFPLQAPKDPDALVPVARDGALRVLKAAAAAKVERTVLTSSTVAVLGGRKPDANRVHTEEDWSILDSSNAYGRSKTLAERAAWDFIKAEGGGMSLVSVNPSFVLGPPLDGEIETSAEFILLFLRGKYPLVPDFGIEIVDVRCVAAAHLAAMEKPAAAGKRYILSGGALHLRDIARIIGDNFPEYRSRMPRGRLPDVVTRFLGLFDPAVRSIVPDLGPVKRVSNKAAETELGIGFRSPEEAVIAMTRGIIEHHLI
jgi:nucleoside-diphosphate-sugar epimerase